MKYADECKIKYELSRKTVLQFLDELYKQLQNPTYNKVPYYGLGKELYNSMQPSIQYAKKLETELAQRDKAANIKKEIQDIEAFINKYEKNIDNLMISFRDFSTLSKPLDMSVALNFGDNITFEIYRTNKEGQRTTLAFNSLYTAPSDNDDGSSFYLVLKDYQDNIIFESLALPADSLLEILKIVNEVLNDIEQKYS